VATIAVTGAASGIGLACCDRLADAGHRLLTVDLETADIPADLATTEGRRAAVDAVSRHCDGHLGGLVTCAGLAGAPWRSGAELVSVNFFGTVELLAGLRPLLAASPDGAAAVAISSNSVTIQPGLPEEVSKACLANDEHRARDLADTTGSLAAYPASKLAIARWVRRHAPTPEWAGSGIRLNALAPGMTDTPMVAEGRADPDVAPLLDMLPLPVGHTGRPDQLAALIELLLGPQGSFFCGSVILVDGGTEALLRPDDWPAPWAIDVDKAVSALRGHG
jgi:NAD(P)-dependent dehydrogenase (short-subunit alcohol dehydrogenase family)